MKNFKFSEDDKTLLFIGIAVSMLFVGTHINRIQTNLDLNLLYFGIFLFIGGPIIYIIIKNNKRGLGK